MLGELSIARRYRRKVSTSSIGRPSWSTTVVACRPSGIVTATARTFDTLTRCSYAVDEWLQINTTVATRGADLCEAHRVNYPGRDVRESLEITNPGTPTRFSARVAQRIERLFPKQEVPSSILGVGTSPP